MWHLFLDQEKSQIGRKVKLGSIKSIAAAWQYPYLISLEQMILLLLPSTFHLISTTFHSLPSARSLFSLKLEVWINDTLITKANERVRLRKYSLVNFLHTPWTTNQSFEPTISVFFLFSITFSSQFSNPEVQFYFLLHICTIAIENWTVKESLNQTSYKKNFDHKHS